MIRCMSTLSSIPKMTDFPRRDALLRMFTRQYISTHHFLDHVNGSGVLNKSLSNATYQQMRHTMVYNIAREVEMHSADTTAHARARKHE